ncbi:hypothetical protein C1H46_014067 [Malus baccata]|uniref:Uncharacterized protein n=1 Tax=Malus baccata TaxID=106549 RepID=A0A540MPM6_MALBA|nr:hypothetical protein C1H46_014067 [Malus baccata]
MMISDSSYPRLGLKDLKSAAPCSDRAVLKSAATAVTKMMNSDSSYPRLVSAAPTGQC